MTVLRRCARPTVRGDLAVCGVVEGALDVGEFFVGVTHIHLVERCHELGVERSHEFDGRGVELDVEPTAAVACAIRRISRFDSSRLIIAVTLAGASPSCCASSEGAMRVWRSMRSSALMSGGPSPKCAATFV